MKPETNYLCPDCSDKLFILEGQGVDLICGCTTCGKHFQICQDGEFENGMWRDTSTIAEIKPTHEL